MSGAKKNVENDAGIEGSKGLRDYSLRKKLQNKQRFGATMPNERACLGHKRLLVLHFFMTE